MSLPQNHGKPRQFRILDFRFWILVTLLSIAQSASAHKMEVAEDVAGTFHIEPHDSPRAGVSAPAWIALTHKGGKLIPLQECNCKLAIYAEPHSESSPPLLQPALKAVSADESQNIIGSDITFPKPGAYHVELTGKPVDGKSFHPFELAFAVTVAQGAPVATSSPNQAQVTPTPNQIVESQQERESKSTPVPFYLVSFLAAAAVIGSLFFVLQRRKGSGGGGDRGSGG